MRQLGSRRTRAAPAGTQCPAGGLVCGVPLRAVMGLGDAAARTAGGRRAWGSANVLVLGRRAATTVDQQEPTDASG